MEFSIHTFIQDTGKTFTFTTMTIALKMNSMSGSKTKTNNAHADKPWHSPETIPGALNPADLNCRFLRRAI